jgi:uncharacterized membrane protein
MTLLVIGLVLFFGVHSLVIVAPGARERLQQGLGRHGWRGVHSVVSLAGFVLIVMGYGQSRLSPDLLYTPPFWMRHVTFALLLPVFPLLIAAYLPGRIKATLKHPMLVAVKLWALAHLLSNGTLADVLLFGSFLAWAVADRISLKRRSPVLQSAVAPRARNDVIAVVLGVALYVATLFWLHRLVIGMPLMAHG